MSTDYLSALGAGSGLNVPQIVDALVDAERVPKQNKIDDAKETASVKISALGALKNELSVFQTNSADQEDERNKTTFCFRYSREYTKRRTKRH